MSDPVLRRSGRNIAKKEAAPQPPPAPAPKKRASAEPKKPAAKKAKTAVEKTAAAVKLAVGKDKEKKEDKQEEKEEEETARAGEKAAPATASSSSAAANTTTVVAPTPKPAAKAKGGRATKGKKNDAATNDGAVTLKDGDLLPKELPEVQTHDGGKTTLNAILEKASRGIVIFSYPKASTPECTTQACLFRDSYTAFSGAGYSVYGLSGDQPGVNEKFRTKQNLPYTLLCDPTYELHEKLGVKKLPKGTIRSVIVIQKVSEDGHTGKILRKTKASAAVSLQVAKVVVGIDKEGEKKDAAGDVALPDAGATGDASA